MRLTERAFREYRDDYAGYCRNCDDVTNESGCEPDARRYICDVCDKRTVYGMEEALMMGWITFKGETSEPAILSRFIEPQDNQTPRGA